jgi:hypothetical protein
VANVIQLGEGVIVALDGPRRPINPAKIDARHNIRRNFDPDLTAHVDECSRRLGFSPQLPMAETIMCGVPVDPEAEQLDMHNRRVWTDRVGVAAFESWAALAFPNLVLKPREPRK